MKRILVFIFVSLFCVKSFCQNQFMEPAIEDTINIFYNVNVYYKYPPGEGLGLLHTDFQRISFKSNGETLSEKTDFVFYNNEQIDLYDYLVSKYKENMYQSIQEWATNNDDYTSQILPALGSIQLIPCQVDTRLKRGFVNAMSRRLCGRRTGLSKTSLMHLSDVLSPEFFLSDTLIVVMTQCPGERELGIITVPSGNEYISCWRIRNSSDNYPIITGLLMRIEDYKHYLSDSQHELSIDVNDRDNPFLLVGKETIITLCRRGNRYRVINCRERIVNPFEILNLMDDSMTN